MSDQPHHRLKRYRLHWNGTGSAERLPIDCPELKWQIWDWKIRHPVVHLENRALGRQICKLLNESAEARSR